MARSKFSLIYTIIILFLLLGVHGAGAQIPQPPMPRDLLDGGGRFGIKMGQTGSDDFHARPSPRPPHLRNASRLSPQVDLGQPGFSLRYVQTYGTAASAYSDDAAHINMPGGLGTDGTNIWIAEGYGRRALKFTNTGNMLRQIGKAGYEYLYDEAYGGEIVLNFLTDVAVDSGGNIWVVDGGASHVIQFDSTGNFLAELGETWWAGGENNHFDYPYSIAFDSNGNIYVSDENNHRIQVFDSSGAYLRTIGVTGVFGSDNNHFNYPTHIAIDSNNLLYVGDWENHRVQILDVSNLTSVTHVANIGVPGVSGDDNSHLFHPEGVAVDIANNRIYVADGDNRRVQVFNYNNRLYQDTIDIDSAYPTDVAVDSAGNLYVSRLYYSYSDVWQFNASKVHVRTYGSTGVPYATDDYHYNQPSGVAVSADGSLYIGESAGSRLVKLNAAGVSQWAIGTPGVRGGENDQFRRIEDVDLDSTGQIYVVDRGNHRVQIFSPGGNYFATLGTGLPGTGNTQFNYPHGVAIAPDGKIYVADRENQRVQVFDSNRNYLATLGGTGIPGNDNTHFDGPRDVDVDAAGNIYVVDQYNHRIQVFNSNRTFLRTIGVSGVNGWDFGHLNYPTAVAVDAAGRTYISDDWGHRVLVYDNQGKFLTIFGGGWVGSQSGDMLSTEGLAVDSAGTLYLAELENHRVQKFVPGVPRWSQKNINGFGDPSNVETQSLEVFQGQLYAATSNWNDGAQIWRINTDGDWLSVMTSGFGVTDNAHIRDFLVFQDKIYAATAGYNGTNGGEIWRSDNGTSWNRVVAEGFGDVTNGGINCLAEFDNQIFAGASSYTDSHGGEIWRSSSGNDGSWTQSASNGFDGDTSNRYIRAMLPFDDYLYAGTQNNITGAEVWRTSTGVEWTQVNLDGFGEGEDNGHVVSFAVFNGSLYAGTSNCNAGGQIWRSANGTSWDKVVDAGFGDLNNCNIQGLMVHNGFLYAATYNHPWNDTQTGIEIWRTADGINWESINPDGFGDSNNKRTHNSSAVTVFNNTLFFGTRNAENGGELWQFLDKGIYLPLIIR